MRASRGSAPSACPRRAQAVRAFARAYAGDRLRLDAGATLDEITESLLAVPGVGPWTAQMIAMQAAGQPDDLGLRRAAGNLTGADRTLDAREMEAMAEAWRPNRALAATHLWMSARP